MAQEEQNERDIHYLAGEVEALTIICSTLFARLVTIGGASIAFERTLNEAIQRSLADPKHSQQSRAGIQDRLKDFTKHVQGIRDGR